MKPIRILVDSFADAGLPNAQMGNAREIICRLDPDAFHVSTFVVGEPDARIAARKNTHLIQLPQRRQTVRILSEFLLGSHQLLFYLKASPASRWYLSLRKKTRDRRVTIGTIESQCDLHQNPDVSAGAIELWEQTILRCERLYSNCGFVARSLQEQYGLSSEVIATGADTGFFTPDWGRPANSRPQVLYVGSLRRRKHPEVVISAARRFPEADFKIVGGGPLGVELEARIERGGLKNVKLVGVLGAEQLRDEYRRADVLFFPSTFEGSPKVIVEAAACGLPVVVRDCYSPETVLNGVTGYAAGTEEELYCALQALLASSELRLRLGHAGRRHSLQFDWNLITAQWAAAFTRLASENSLRQAS